ncbi:MAG: hypothetical protein IJ099_04330 [Alphaproteobacteria bacterium]|nr:hypothetical protein [Alphaproteobacteria bacterium]
MNDIAKAQERKERNRFKLAAEKVMRSNPKSKVLTFYTKKPVKDIANGEGINNGKVTREMFDLVFGKVLESQTNNNNRAVREKMSAARTGA